MSKIALEPNASGTGTFSIASPNSNSNRTLTLPDATGTLATTADIPDAGTTLLGTMNTTSGTSVTLSGLTLTDYKYLWLEFRGVSTTVGGAALSFNSGVLVRATPGSSSGTSESTNGSAIVWLSTGVFSSWAAGGNQASGVATTVYSGVCGITNASTSVTFGDWFSNTFDAGSIRIYGVK